MTSSRDISVAVGPVDCTVAVPGSKSIANRALVCAALAGGGTEIANVPDGDDSVAMIRSLRDLGVDIAEPDIGTFRFMAGLDLESARPVRVDAGLAGTTSRFLTALCALRSGPTVVDGGEALKRRPMADLHDALAALGGHVNSFGQPGHLPVEVSRGGIRGGDIEIPGSVSSQFTTALLLIAPYLRGGLRLVVSGDRVSNSYIEMTVAVMRDFGAVVDFVESDRGLRVVVSEGSYQSRYYAVEPDASSASYPLAMAAVGGGAVTIEGLGSGSLQGDTAFAEVLDRMGCGVTVGLDSVTVRRNLADALKGIDINMVDMSDLVPTLAVVALFAGESTRIRGVGFIRRKESDRLGDLAAELRKCGASIVEVDDGLIIEPAALHGAHLGTHDDHRLAMAFAVLAGRVTGISIDDPDVVSKSWPGFWAARRQIAESGR